MTQILMIIQQDMLLFLCMMLFVLFAVSNALIKYQLADKGCPKGFRSAVINMVPVVSAQYNHQQITETLQSVEKRSAFYKVNMLVVEDVSMCIEKSLLGNDAATLSSFLEPSEVFAFTDALNSISKNMNLKYVFHGGHKEAEYRRVVLRRHDLLSSSDSRYGQEENVWALAVECTASDSSSKPAQPLKIDLIRKALASILSVDKREIGDIALPGQKNAFQCFVTEKAVMAAQTLLSAENLSSIRLLSMPVESIRVINCSEVKIAPLKEKEITISEASNRLDAVGSGGFGISRSKMTKLIADGAVMVDWSVTTTASTAIKPRQLLSATGLGQLYIEDISTTSKGRCRVKCVRRTRPSIHPGSLPE